MAKGDMGSGGPKGMGDPRIQMMLQNLMQQGNPIMQRPGMGMNTGPSDNMFQKFPPTMNPNPQGPVSGTQTMPVGRPDRMKMGRY